MGVRGLTSYVEKIQSLWTQKELQNEKLVIDGSALCNCLYRDYGFDRRCGGQYEEFYDKVVSFFKALKSKDVEALVILDGAYDQSDAKLETRKKRSEKRIQTFDMLSKCSEPPLNNDGFQLPLLSKHVFVQALEDLAIKFAVSDNEADAAIASLANAWNCPVLTSDSDFYIFDIEVGYIPLNFLKWQSNGLTARIFQRRYLAQHFGILPELLPLFASLVGNDYVSLEVLEPLNRALKLRGKEAKFSGIAKILSRSNTETVALKSALQRVSSHESRDQLEKAVERSLWEYAITESNLSRYFERGEVFSSLKTENKGEIDEWVLRKFRDGKFSTDCMSSLTGGKVLLNVQIENCQEISANRCSQWLRQFKYGILNDEASHGGGGNISTVQEWDREHMRFEPSDISPHQSNQEVVVPCLSLIPSLDAEKRSAVLFNGLKSNTANVKSLPEKFKLIAASLRFLNSNAQPPLKPNHLDALLCSCVMLEDGSWKEYLEVDTRRIPFDVRAAHSFSQWQCVLRDAVHLNFVLCEPVPTPCIRKTFNGQLAHQLHRQPDQGRKPKSLISQSIVSRYDELYTAITNQEENDEITTGIQNLQLQATSSD